MALSSEEKQRENLAAQKSAHKVSKFQRALFHGKLTKKQRPVVNGYSGPVGKN